MNATRTALRIHQFALQYLGRNHSSWSIAWLITRNVERESHWYLASLIIELLIRCAKLLLFLRKQLICDSPGVSDTGGMLNYAAAAGA